MSTSVTDKPNRLAGEISFEERQRQLEAEEAAQKLEQERLEKNANFYMIFKSREGSPALRRLVNTDRHAASLFLFIAETMGRDNCLVASYSALAAAISVSKATVGRAMKVLETEHYLIRMTSGSTSVICLNPEVVWSSYANKKDTCLFNNAKVLMTKEEQPDLVKKRFTMLIQKRLEAEGALFPEALEQHEEHQAAS